MLSKLSCAQLERNGVVQRALPCLKRQQFNLLSSARMATEAASSVVVPFDDPLLVGDVEVDAPAQPTRHMIDEERDPFLRMEIANFFEYHQTITSEIQRALNPSSKTFNLETYEPPNLVSFCTLIAAFQPSHVLC
eukprot:Platyproteum_vivax@DN12980_c0_g1_i1.p1